MKSNSARIFTLALVSILSSVSFGATCQDLFARSGAPIEAMTEARATVMVKLAVDALLKSKVSDDVVASFDFGVEGFETSIVEARSSKSPVDDYVIPKPVGVAFDLQNGNAVTFFTEIPKSNVKMVMIGGDIFSNAFYAAHLNDKGQIGPKARNQLSSQPWLEWMPSQKSYTVHETGAADRLLSVLVNGQKTLHVYRGTLAQEARLIGLKRALQSSDAAKLKLELARLSNSARTQTNLARFATTARVPSAPIEWAALKKAFYEALGTDLKETLGGGSLFVSPSKSKATSFVKGDGVLISYEVPVEKLAALIQSKSIYIGVESAIEISFMDPLALEVLLDGERGVAKATSQNGNIFGAGSQHPIWR